jgi:hypothetical protein
VKPDFRSHAYRSISNLPFFFCKKKLPIRLKRLKFLELASKNLQQSCNLKDFFCFYFLEVMLICSTYATVISQPLLTIEWPDKGRGTWFICVNRDKEAIYSTI